MGFESCFLCFLFLCFTVCVFSFLPSCFVCFAATFCFILVIISSVRYLSHLHYYPLRFHLCLLFYQPSECIYSCLCCFVCLLTSCLPPPLPQQLHCCFPSQFNKETLFFAACPSASITAYIWVLPLNGCKTTPYVW